MTTLAGRAAGVAVAAGVACGTIGAVSLQTSSMKVRAATTPALTDAATPSESLRAMADRLRGGGIEAEIAQTGEGDDRGARSELLLARVPGTTGNPGVLLGPYEAPGMAEAGVDAISLLKAESPSGMRGDVVLVAVQPGEGSAFAPASAIEWILKNRQDLLSHVRFAITGGGRTAGRPAPVKPGGQADPRPLWIGVAEDEKLAFDVAIVAKGDAGTAATPQPDSAILRLGRALARLSSYQPLPRLVPETRALFNGLAAVSPAIFSKKEIENLDAVVDIVREQVRAGGSALNPKYETRTIEGPHTREVSNDPAHSAILRDTFAVTRIAAGVRPDMVPGEARAILRCSILPDTNAADFIVELRRAAGDDGLEWSIAANGANAQADGSSGESAPAAALSKAVRSAFAQLWPGTPVLPYLSPSPAGIQALRRHGIAAIGFTPPAAREPAPASGAGSGAQALVKIVNGL